MRKRRTSTDGPADVSRHRRLRLDDVWDEDEDEDEKPCRIRALRPRRTYPDDYPDPEDELSGVLRTLDYHREGMQEQTSYLQTLLQCDSELAVKWKQFTSAGGISAEDWERFLAGNFRSRITRTRRHMRLVSSRSPRIRLRRSPPDEVA
jgi:hypothetical protein